MDNELEKLKEENRILKEKLALFEQKTKLSEDKVLSTQPENKINQQSPELIEAENEIEYQRNKLNNLFMNAPAVICLLEGPEHIFSLSNPNYQKITGNRSIVGKPIREALPELAGQGFYELLDEVYNTGKPFIGNALPVTVDMSGNGILETIYMNFVYQPIFNVNNEIDGISVFAFDVTDLVEARKRAEELSDKLNKQQIILKENEQHLEEKVQERTKELKAEQAKLYDLFMNAPAIICVFNGPKHIFEFANPDYHRLYNNRQLIGKTVREALPELEGQVFFELLDKVYRTGEPYIGKEIPATINKENDGILVDVYFNFIYQPIFDKDNHVTGITVFAYDITEQVSARKKIEALADKLMESEAKYKYLAESLEIKVEDRTAQLNAAKDKIELQSNKLNNLFMNAPAGICLLRGPQHVFEFTNPIYDQLVGKRDYISQSVKQVVPEAEGQGFFELLDGVYNTAVPFVGNELPLTLNKNNDGILETLYFNFVYQPDFNSKNEVEGINVFAFDVTDQALSRQKAEEITQKLIKSNEQLQQFAYIASHDLQEPLRTVTSYIELLQRRMKDKLNGDEKEFMELIIAATKRMSNLIQDLLSYSKVGLQENEFKLTDLNKVLETVFSNLKTTIENSNAQINHESLPSIKVVGAQIIQLFQNLLSNSIKYRNKQVRPVINIFAEKKGNEWIFSVSDNGIGIKEEYFEKIFLIFQRLHGRDEFEGTGIGLATCKKIIEIHSGKIWLESTEGKGSTFFFSLPG